jgi:hypothetical protein
MPRNSGQYRKYSYESSQRSGGSPAKIGQKVKEKPLARGLGGVPPISKVPQDWGIKGVEKWLINNLIFLGSVC